MELEYRHVIKFLYMKSLKLGEIATELSNTCGQDASAPEHEILVISNQAREKLSPKATCCGTTAIRRYWRKNYQFMGNSCPCQCERLLTPWTFLPPRSIPIWWKRLILNFWSRRLPHILTSELRQKRVELAGQLLRVLEQQERVGFPDGMTGPESWFLQHYHHRKIPWNSTSNGISL
jgi:hypothetical protein